MKTRQITNLVGLAFFVFFLGGCNGDNYPETKRITGLQLISPTPGLNNYTPYHIYEAGAGGVPVRSGYNVEIQVRGGAYNAAYAKSGIRIEAWAFFYKPPGAGPTCPCFYNLWGCTRKSPSPPPETPGDPPGLGMFDGQRCGGCDQKLYRKFTTDGDGRIKHVIEINRKKDDGSGLSHPLVTDNFVSVHCLYRVHLTADQYKYVGFKWVTGGYNHPGSCTAWGGCSTIWVLTETEVTNLWPTDSPPESNRAAAGGAVAPEPECDCNLVNTDTDGDGARNCYDPCPNDPTRWTPGACPCGSLKVEPGICGCHSLDVDSDGDGPLDCLDSCPNRPYHNQPPCVPFDHDNDGDVDLEDFGSFQLCVRSSYWESPFPPECREWDWNLDGYIDANDLGLMRQCQSGSTVPASLDCVTR